MGFNKFGKRIAARDMVQHEWRVSVYNAERFMEYARLYVNTEPDSEEWEELREDIYSLGFPRNLNPDVDHVNIIVLNARSN
jgi:hypothetical protein